MRARTGARTKKPAKLVREFWNSVSRPVYALYEIQLLRRRLLLLLLFGNFNMRLPMQRPRLRPFVQIIKARTRKLHRWRWRRRSIFIIIAIGLLWFRSGFIAYLYLSQSHSHSNCQCLHPHRLGERWHAASVGRIWSHDSGGASTPIRLLISSNSAPTASTAPRIIQFFPIFFSSDLLGFCSVWPPLFRRADSRWRRFLPRIPCLVVGRIVS